MSTPQHHMIQTLFDRGHTAEQVAEITGLSIEQLGEMMATDDYQNTALHGPAIPTHDGPVTPQEALEWAEGMTRPAMQALQEIIENPRTPAANRLRATELILSWRAEFQQRKADAERRVVQHVLIDTEALARMHDVIDLVRDPRMQRMISEARTVMPNSTA